MQTIIITSETLAELKAGKVEGISLEMVNYIEDKNIKSIEIFPESQCIILTDSVSDCAVCDFNQTYFGL